MNAIQTLIDHAREVYPHFESPRGQQDISAAQSEYTRLTAERDELRRALKIAQTYVAHYGKGPDASEDLDTINAALTRAGKGSK